jgi:long-subunit fatty acid transport protein
VRAPERRVDARSTGGFDVLALGSGVQVSRSVRLGLTVNRWSNGYTQNLMRQGRSTNSVQESRFRLQGWNVHAGGIWSVNDRLNLGAAVKTPFTAKARLARSRQDVGTGPNAYRRDDLEIDWPKAVGVGLSWRPRSPLTLSMDYTRTSWSDSRIRNFFTLPPVSTPAPPEDFFPDLPYPTLNDDHQRDTEEIRAGVEYVVIHGRLRWPLRAGMFFDRQYFNQVDDGPPRFRGVTAGTGLIVGPVLVDAAVVLEWGQYVSGDTPARVKVRSHRFLFSAIYRQGAR